MFFNKQKIDIGDKEFLYIELLKITIFGFIYYQIINIDYNSDIECRIFGPGFLFKNNIRYGKNETHLVFKFVDKNDNEFEFITIKNFQVINTDEFNILFHVVKNILKLNKEHMLRIKEENDKHTIRKSYFEYHSNNNRYGDGQLLELTIEKIDNHFIQITSIAGLTIDQLPIAYTDESVRGTNIVAFCNTDGNAIIYYNNGKQTIELVPNLKIHIVDFKNYLTMMSNAYSFYLRLMESAGL